jgi:gliding motility-associated-like protein
VINLTGQTNITLNFDYIEMGSPPNDDASVWYFDGSTWALLVNTPATTVNCPGGQGRWTAFSIALPASANNNANVKIGFRWVNNDDGVGTDPSFAVDNMTLTVPSTPAPPVAAFTPSATNVCVGQAVNFTDNSTGTPTTWNWTFPSGTPPTANTQNVTGVIWNTAGTYTVSLTAANASGNSTTNVVITVNPSPTVTVTSTQQTICQGNSTTLTASGASTYGWLPGPLNGSPVSVTPASTTTYTLTGTSAAGCQDTAQYTVYVQACPGPVAAFSSSDTTVCIGQAVNFTDLSTGPPTSWSWTFPSGTPPAANTQNVTGVTWNAAGSYTVQLTATNANGSNTASLVITVAPTPTVSVTASQQTICQGNNTTLTASGATSYDWLPGPLSGSPVIVTPAATTTYTLTGTDAQGCQDTAQYTVYVQACPGPTPAFSASDTTICIGQAINFTDLSTGAPVSWSWTFPSGNPASATTQNVTGVSWSAAGSYTVTLAATNANGTNSTTIVITVVPSLTVTASANPAVICTGQQSALTGSGAATYVWTPGPISGSPVNVTPPSTTTYTVVGTDVNGCTGSGQVTVTVQPCLIPVVNFLASDTTICVGDCISYTDQSTNNPTSWSWTFSGAATATSNAQNPTNICYNSPGTFAVTLIATNASGSGSLTKTGYITVNPPPAAFAGSDVTICSGQQTVLNGSGGNTLLWQPGNQTTSSYTVTPLTTTTYTLTVTDNIGCTAQDSVVVTVNICTVPTSTFSASETNFCAGTCISLNDNSTGSPTGWNWQFPGGTPASSSQQNPTNICYNTPGTYTVTLIVNNAFGADTSTLTVTAGTPPTADAGPFTSIAIGNQTTLTATGGTGSYSWSPSTGLSAPNSATTTASPTVTTTYTVTFTDANGCMDSDTVTVEVIEAYGIFIPGAFSPNNDGANDQLFVYGAGIKSLEFVVYDRFGEKVFESYSVNDGWDGTFRGKDMNSGIYAWYCVAEFYDGTAQTLHGDVTLMR